MKTQLCKGGVSHVRVMLRKLVSVENEAECLYGFCSIQLVFGSGGKRCKRIAFELGHIVLVCHNIDLDVEDDSRTMT